VRRRAAAAAPRHSRSSSYRARHCAPQRPPVAAARSEERSKFGAAADVAAHNAAPSRLVSRALSVASASPALAC
jgi:hypothetical protein